MRTRLAVPWTLSLLLLGAAAARGETIEGLPVHVHRFDSEAIRVWVGDHISSTATVAIPTSAGIIVIDTTGEPKIDPELRRLIARELGRDDFVMLINTHEHGDHTGGNGVYADCEIVGHELVAAGMAHQAEGFPRRLEWSRRSVGELEARIAGLAAGDPELPRLHEELIIQKMHAEWLANPPAPAPPTRTFSDRLDLEVGDTKLELYYIGGMHSASDIAVLVPEHGLLLTGDTMADVWLTDSPGCLGAFAAHPGVHHEFPLLLENWNLLLARKADVATLVPGHWNGELSWAGFEARVRYIEALWAGVRRLAAAGATLDAVQQEYALPTRFPELVGSPGCDRNLNAGTIREMWYLVTGQQYASDALNAAMRNGAGFSSVIAEIRAKSPTYYYDEASLNGLGYWFLEIDEIPMATEVFRLVVDLFPESWNAYDSFAEGLLRAGDREGAIANYERSLQLNPDNANGRHMLDRIRSGEEDPVPIPPGPPPAAAGNQAEGFSVLTGPYLGQRPPGRTPEVFAPGIVASAHGSVTISNDGTEIYWADDRIYRTRLENGRWTRPEPLSFSIEGAHDDGPKLSPDNRKLYFNSDRPRWPGDSRRERVWCVARAAGDWDEPGPLGPEINDAHLHWQVAVDPAGRLYFGSERRGAQGQDDVFVAEPRPGGFAQPVSLDAAVNSGAHEGSPFVSVDGRYLIFLRDSGLWVSFRGQDGRWKPSRPLPTPERAACPYVSPDGRYLFFLRFDRDPSGTSATRVYWMDTAGLGLDAEGG